MDNTIGIDTLKFYLSDFEVSQRNKLMLHPAKIDSNGEPQGEYVLWRNQGGEVRGNKASFNDDINVTIMGLGSGVKCLVQCSLPKIFNGEGSNLELLSREQTADAIEMVRKSFESVGIKGNIQNAGISRIDTTRNILTDDRVSSYSKVLQVLKAKRSVKTSYGTETFNWGNKQQEITAYDKVEEMQHQKLSTDGLPDILRIETKLLNASKVKSVLGGIRVADVLQKDYYRNIQDKHLVMLEDYLFRESPKIVQFKGQRDLEKELSASKNIFGRNFVQAYLKMKGLESVLERYTMDEFISAYLRLSDIKDATHKKTLRYRMQKNLFKLHLQSEQIQSELFKKRNFADMYTEIRDKALSKVA
jgi:hypothetical protein